MNLVWLDINSSYSHSSLALPAIEACRCGDVYEWSVVSGTIGSDLYSLTNELYVAKPNVVAATLWLFNHEVVMRVCQRISALMPEVRIILGGPEFNGDNEAFLRQHPYVESVFRGEGERGFHEVIGDKSRDQIVGLCYLDGEGIYHDNGLARVADFESLPLPESSRFFNFESPFVQIETSRGCFNSCAFCVSGGDKPIRSKSVETMAERVESVRSHGVKDIRILDRTFNYSVARAREMLNLFRGYADMNFHLEIHPALLSDELCRELADMPDGVLHLEAGMQSLDDKVIEASGRIGTNVRAIQGLSRLCEMDNFETHADLIAGLPHYTLSQIFSDVKQLAQIGAGEIQLELLKLLPGTKMRREATTLGIRYASAPPYEVLQTPDIDPFELDRARLLSRLLDRYYNSDALRETTRELIVAEPNLLCDFLDYLIVANKLEQPISLEKRVSMLFKFCRERMPQYLDMVSMLWINCGFSLRREEAGDISKATELPPHIERQHNTHYYIWRGDQSRCLVCYDRSVDHSKPEIIEL
ncbi:MAG: DUF4080 domain-containing protein [Rikenellaceae bacterium]